MTCPPERRARRRHLVTVLAACACVAVGLAGIRAGSSQLTTAEIARVLLGAGAPAQELVMLEFRLPRVVGGLAVGACLGLAGALTQTFARNPLATPDILGVTSGAAAGAVAAICLGGGTYGVGPILLTLGMPAAAAVGALATAAVVYGLAWRGGVESYRLILIGIGATAALGGVTSYLIATARITDASAAAQWMVGNLSGISWASVWPVLAALAVMAPVAATQARNLAVGQLGDELAAGLGVPLQRHRLIVIGCAVVLTAAAVSASGPVEFAAFVAPQIALRLAGAARPPLVASALAGAVLVAGADAVSRGVLPGETPVGIITAVVGAPYLIWLLIRRPGGRGSYE
ncbi:MAG: iron chelate uptake ABC transporter family permease subunit [Bifidobacteriaceae bacterium]|jgi:iron complex transport system permease protein|nr:iron chelate uptake ABC transporter family permease subunit [Bifidobacteriaceae bacterium]